MNTSSDFPIGLPRWPWFVPPSIGFALIAIYVFFPDFYLTHVLEPNFREFQWVENFTFVTALTGGILLWVTALRWPVDGDRRFHHRGVLLLAVTGLASLFFAGEEVSWGQNLFGWETPEQYSKLSVETNLHNTKLPIQSLGSWFIAMVFFIFPAAARFTKRIPDALRAVVPSNPVVFCMTFGFLWKGIKTVYRLKYPETGVIPDIIYDEFIEQINEQKEMFIALGLLLFSWDVFIRLPNPVSAPEARAEHNNGK